MDTICEECGVKNPIENGMCSMSDDGQGPHVIVDVEPEWPKILYDSMFGGQGYVVAHDEEEFDQIRQKIRERQAQIDAERQAHYDETH